MKTTAKLPEFRCRWHVLNQDAPPTYTFCQAPAELFLEPRYTTRRWFCAEHIPSRLCIAYSWHELQRLLRIERTCAVMGSKWELGLIDPGDALSSILAAMEATT